MDEQKIMEKTGNAPAVIRWGIVGLGRIAHLFVRDLMLVPGAQLQAVASSSEDRAGEFASAYGIPRAYGSYEELYQDPEVDVVYVATLHHQHFHCTIQALQAGKHVLCEKPVAMTMQQCSQMVQLAADRGLFFMEALWSRFNPSIRKILELVRAGAIGKPRYLNAEFSFFMLNDDLTGRTLNPEMAAGSFLDIGIYPLFLSYAVLGYPSEIMARALYFHNHAEIQTSVMLHYPEAQALLHSSLAHQTEMSARIEGEEGIITIDPVWHETTGFTLENASGKKEFRFPLLGKGYALEIIEVQQCLEQNKVQSDLWSWQDSLNLMRMADQVREQANIRYPFEP